MPTNLKLFMNKEEELARALRILTSPNSPTSVVFDQTPSSYIVYALEGSTDGAQLLVQRHFLWDQATQSQHLAFVVRTQLSSTEPLEMAFPLLDHLRYLIQLPPHYLGIPLALICLPSWLRLPLLPIL